MIAEKLKIHIRCQNGIDFNTACKDILWELTNEIEFIDSDHPDFILFGPYGNDIPEKGNYLRIGYFCENIIPNLKICDWAFGIPLESEINSPKYKRIQWHGLKPVSLIKNLTDNDIDFILNQKQNFCNFFYSHQVPYREKFFQALSKYKKVDAPGKSMNNMPSIDDKFTGDIWERKRQFLTQYKFTIAFENYIYPGYQTEKLYDAMLCNSLPIYLGDPAIGNIFNTNSFLNVPDYMALNDSSFLRQLERSSQMIFNDILPQYHHQIKDRFLRKVKSFGRNLKMQMQLNNLNFEPVIERIIEIDKNPSLYIQYLKQPWLINNTAPDTFSLKKQWLKIFNDRTN